MKKVLLSLFLFICELPVFCQTSVIELAYNVNGYQYAALCVLNGGTGKCSVLSNQGNCWYDAYYTDYGNYSTITTSNPSINGWLPCVLYFTSSGNYMQVQNYKIPISANMVSRNNWNLKKAQYGFKIDGTSFRGRKCTYPIGSSTCSKLHYCSGFVEGRTITTCKNCPHESSWHK